MYDKLAIRRWSARFLTMAAVILTGGAVYTLTLIPLDTRIPVPWLHPFSANAPDHLGIWVLFVIPAALIVLALLLRCCGFWLPRRPASRKFIWLVLLALQPIAAAAQYVVLRDAVAAALQLPA